MVTFTCNFRGKGSKGTERWFLLREQVMVEGKIDILVDPIEMLTVEAYRYVDGEEWWILPTDVVVEDDTVIPPHKKSLTKYWRERYYVEWTGDVRGLILDIAGKDIHGKVNHNGMAIWREIQEKSPERKVKFNASDGVSLNKIKIKEEDVYYLK